MVTLIEVGGAFGYATPTLRLVAERKILTSSVPKLDEAIVASEVGHGSFNRAQEHVDAFCMRMAEILPKVRPGRGRTLSLSHKPLPDLEGLFCTYW